MSKSKPTPGIDVRHARSCPSRNGERCACTPSYQAHVHDRRTGKRIRRTFATRSAAKLWRQDALVAVRTGALRPSTTRTLADAAAEWLAGARRGEIRNRSGDPYKPSTIRAYEQNLRLRVLPALGTRKLGDVTRADLSRLVERLTADGLSPSTVQTTILPLRAIYRRAQDHDEVAANPTAGLRLPAIRGRRDRVADPAEAVRLLHALAVEDRVLWATALYAGLRRGELTALRWEDMDLAGGTIRVQRGWDHVEGEIAPKSREGRRTVPIPAALRDHLLDARLRADPGTVRVFTGQSAIQTATERARDRWAAADLPPITLHECRHTYASLMIAAGVNAKTLSVFMGHANIAITLDLYGHLMPGSEAQAADMLDAYLDRARAATAEPQSTPETDPTVAQSVAHSENPSEDGA